MGCNFVTLHFSGTYDHKTLRDAFDSAVDQSRVEDGNSYSGEIGMATGLIIEDGLTFDNPDDAVAWLSENCVKWEEAKAVRYRRGDGSINWMIGAACAS